MTAHTRKGYGMYKKSTNELKTLIDFFTIPATPYLDHFFAPICNYRILSTNHTHTHTNNIIPMHIFHFSSMISKQRLKRIQSTCFLFSLLRQLFILFLFYSLKTNSHTPSLLFFFTPTFFLQVVLNSGKKNRVDRCLVKISPSQTANIKKDPI